MASWVISRPFATKYPEHPATSWWHGQRGYPYTFGSLEEATILLNKKAAEDTARRLWGSIWRSHVAISRLEDAQVLDAEERTLFRLLAKSGGVLSVVPRSTT